MVAKVVSLLGALHLVGSPRLFHVLRGGVQLEASPLPAIPAPIEPTRLVRAIPSSMFPKRSPPRSLECDGHIHGRSRLTPTESNVCGTEISMGPADLPSWTPYPKGVPTANFPAPVRPLNNATMISPTIEGPIAGKRT